MELSYITENIPIYLYFHNRPAVLENIKKSHCGKDGFTHGVTIIPSLIHFRIYEN